MSAVIDCLDQSGTDVSIHDNLIRLQDSEVDNFSLLNVGSDGYILLLSTFSTG